MPIEIRELIVKATVKDKGADSGGGSSPQIKQQQLVQETVEQVLEILKSSVYER